MFLPQFLSKFKTSFSFCLKTLIPLLFLYSTYQNQKEPSTNIWDRLSWNILKTTIWKLPQNLFFKSLKSNLRRGLSQESGSRQISWAHHGLIGISTKKQFQGEGILKKKNDFKDNSKYLHFCNAHIFATWLFKNTIELKMN